jgi:hypothetical protein
LTGLQQLMIGLGAMTAGKHVTVGQVHSS